MLRWSLRGVVALLVVFAALLAAGFVWDQVASRGFESQYPAPGQKVRLPDGRELHFVIKGEGEPALVLETGAGGPHTDWAPVFDRLAETTRVIAYDRAGYGWSDPSSRHDADSITSDLHHGLEALGVTGPIVLVGHSIGGPYIRHYTYRHPEQVVGMVFVDSSHEDQANRMPPPMVEMMRSMSTMFQAGAFASRFGALRALDSVGANPLAFEGMSDERRAMSLRSATIRAYAQEMGGIEQVLEDTKQAATPLGDMPILVLSATAQDPSDAPPSMREHFDDMTAAWSQMQAELAQLSSNSRHVPVPGAGHYIQFERPDVVVDEIRALIEAVRAGRPLTSHARSSDATDAPSP